jgi:hypothetical protein
MVQIIESETNNKDQLAYSKTRQDDSIGGKPQNQEMILWDAHSSGSENRDSSTPE